MCSWLGSAAGQCYASAKPKVQSSEPRRRHSDPFGPSRRMASVDEASSFFHRRFLSLFSSSPVLEVAEKESLTRGHIRGPTNQTVFVLGLSLRRDTSGEQTGREIGQGSVNRGGNVVGEEMRRRRRTDKKGEIAMEDKRIVV